MPAGKKTKNSPNLARQKSVPAAGTTIGGELWKGVLWEAMQPKSHGTYLAGESQDCLVLVSKAAPHGSRRRRKKSRKRTCIQKQAVKLRLKNTALHINPQTNPKTSIAGKWH